MHRLHNQLTLTNKSCDYVKKKEKKSDLSD